MGAGNWKWASYGQYKYQGAAWKGGWNRPKPPPLPADLAQPPFLSLPPHLPPAPPVPQPPAPQPPNKPLAFAVNGRASATSAAAKVHFIRVMLISLKQSPPLRTAARILRRVQPFLILNVAASEKPAVGFITSTANPVRARTKRIFSRNPSGSSDWDVRTMLTPGCHHIRAD